MHARTSHGLHRRTTGKVDVFAEELARLCKPSGSLYVVSPGEHHLFELKSLIYDNVKLHKAPETPQGFELVERTKLQQTHRMES